MILNCLFDNAQQERLRVEQSEHLSNFLHFGEISQGAFPPMAPREEVLVGANPVGMVWYGLVWYGMVWYGMVLVGARGTPDPPCIISLGPRKGPTDHQLLSSECQ